MKDIAYLIQPLNYCDQSSHIWEKIFFFYLDMILCANITLTVRYGLFLKLIFNGKVNDSLMLKRWGFEKPYIGFLPKMHAKAHGSECRCMYSPDMILGVGTSDFEGHERNFSQIKTSKWSKKNAK